MGLFHFAGRLPGCVKINAPEVRRRSQKLDSHAHTLRAGFSGKHDPAFQFFQGLGVHQHDHGVVIDLMLQRQQAAVGIHHQRFAHLAELPSGMAPAERLQFHAVKHPLAAPVGGKSGFWHSVPMMLPATKPVNCPYGQVFPTAIYFRALNL